MALLNYGRLRIDLDDAVVRTPAGAQSLTEQEADLLRYLSERPETAVSRDELRRAVWGHAAAREGRPVDHCVKRLRRKIEVEPKHPLILLTRRGQGYTLAKPDPTPGAEAPMSVADLRALPHWSAHAQQTLRAHRSLLLTTARTGTPSERLLALRVLADDLEARRRGLVGPLLVALAPDAPALDSLEQIWWQLLDAALGSRGHDPSVRLPLVEHALTLVPEDAVELRIRLHLLGATSKGPVALDGAAMSQAKLGLELSRAHHLPAWSAGFHLGMGNLLADAQDRDGAEQAYLQAVATARRGENVRAESVAHQNLAGEYAFTGRLDAAQEHILRAIALARSIHDSKGVAGCRTNLAIFRAMAGDWTRAEADATRSEAALQRAGEHTDSAVCLLLRGLCAAAQDRSELGLARVREAEALADDPNDRFTREAARAARAAITRVATPDSDVSELLTAAGHPDVDAVRTWVDSGEVRGHGVIHAYLRHATGVA